VISALASYYAHDFEIFGYDKPLISDHSIKVIRSKTGFSVNQIEDFKSEIQSQRSKFRELATRLREDPSFKENYLGSMKNEFNKFSSFANSVNSEMGSKMNRFIRLVKANLHARF
jgi:Fe-S cluster assembly scaffold protein SufB